MSSVLVEVEDEVISAPLPSSQRFRLHAIGWAQYIEIADSLGEAHVRLTYDHGNLELMTLSHGHERFSSLLGRFVEVITEEFDLPIQSGGSTTLNREDLSRGAEPDRCYYLDNEPLVRDKDELDLTVDPPPDLAIEVDITRSSLNRMSIYAALGIPEVWRFDGHSLTICQRNTAGGYDDVPRSRFFPTIPPALIEEFLGRRTELDETRLVRAFRQAVRQIIATDV